MIKGRAQFTGAAGQFHLARELALRGINAALTVGNAPSVDLVATSFCGRWSVAFQVKTARNAYRKKRYGHEGYEWDVNKDVIEKYNESFWYAFINLREEGKAWNPEVFFVPSRWVAEFVKREWKRFMYFLPSTALHVCLERWDVLEGYLRGEQGAIQWANDWPKDKLVQWGKVESHTAVETPVGDVLAADPASV